MTVCVCICCYGGALIPVINNRTGRVISKYTYILTYLECIHDLLGWETSRVIIGCTVRII